ncbi:MAG: response regulator [Candidatus Omnitrophica bacterium]|nr:response regulator [Candidatus Omnitrophota bacterium]MDD5236122.1 response regulator [Candidatus Omnitrophota bacterium]MDD5611213.1 response regulator [Candidatus Omnitrophota bacterium]
MPNPVTNKKILIVSADKTLLEDLKSCLSQHGYDPVTVNNPEIVLKKAATEKPDLILLEISLTGKSGFQVAHDLKSEQVTDPIPVVAIMDQYKQEYSLLFKMCDITKCIEKPFTPEQIVSEIKTIV